MTVARDFRVILSAGFVESALGQRGNCLALILCLLAQAFQPYYACLQLRRFKHTFTCVTHGLVLAGIPG